MSDGSDEHGLHLVCVGPAVATLHPDGVVFQLVTDGIHVSRVVSRVGIGQAACDDWGVRRVSVVGNSGSGKTALARRLAAALDVDHVELDAIFHQPGWIELPHAEFRQRVEVAIGADGWVVDGNYSTVRDLVWAAADTVVWLDLPRRVVMSRVIRRTITRAVTRRELWNGNREPLIGMFRRDPAENIVLWSWTNHGEYARRYASAATDPANAHLAFIRVSSHDDANRLVASVVTSHHS